jgi:hypothetical protein
MLHALAPFIRSATALGLVLRLIKTSWMIIETIRPAWLSGGWIHLDLFPPLTLVIASNKESKPDVKQRDFALAELENAASYDDWVRASLRLEGPQGSLPLPPKESITF